MRLTLCATLALAALGCDTYLDGGSNGDGGGGGGDGVTTATAGNGPAVTTGASVTAAGPSATVGTGPGGGPGDVTCPSTDGLAAAHRIHAMEQGVTAVGLHGDTVVAGTEELEAKPSTFVRIDATSGEVLEREVVANTISSFLDHEGSLFGGGYCLEGGSPFVIEAGPAFEALVEGCPSNPTSALATIAGGLAYEDDDEVWWTPLDHDGPPRRLAEFLPIAPNEMEPFVIGLAADETHVFAVLSRIEFGPDVSWGELWKIPLDGSLPTRLFESEHVPAIGSSFVGGIHWVVVDDDDAYFLTPFNGRVSRVAKAGGPVEVVWEGENWVTDLLAVGSDLIFVDVIQTDFGPPPCAPILRRVPKAGGEAVAIASLPLAAHHLTTDGTSVYFAGGNPLPDGTHASGIFRAPLPLP